MSNATRELCVSLAFALACGWSTYKAATLFRDAETASQAELYLIAASIMAVVAIVSWP